MGTDEKSLRMGICGGTFDPIHIGHLTVAQTVRDLLYLDKVLFIPVGLAPHKDAKKVAPAHHRMNMVKEAVKDHPYFEALDLEVKRGGFTYSVDTLRQLKENYLKGKEDEKKGMAQNLRFYYIIGADVVLELLKWKDFLQVFSLCSFVVVLRPGYDAGYVLEHIQWLKEHYEVSISSLPVPLLDISSTQIRQRVRAKESISDLVPTVVERYMIENKVYG
jgi:nicotinate-nucleotide adenylyltransferase